MEKILIDENRTLLEAIYSDLRYFREPLKALKDTYEALEIGEFTNDLYHEILSQGGLLVAERYDQALSTQLDHAGIVYAKLRNTMLDGTQEQLQRFFTALDKLLNVLITTASGRVVLSVHDITFENGFFLVSDADKENLLEQHCRVYLENKNEQKLYDTLNEISTAIEKLESLAKEFDLPADLYGFPNSPLHLVSQFFHFVDDKMQINPNMIRHSINLKAKMDKYNTDSRRNNLVN